MDRPKPTFIGIPVEVRNKIYSYSLKMPDEFVVCECPEHARNELGLCDFNKGLAAWGSSTGPGRQCRPTRMLKNPKIALLLLCKQTADEVKDITTRLPILVFCKSICCYSFINDMDEYYNLDRTDIWAMKVKEYADPQYDPTGNFTSIASGSLDIVHMPDFLDELSLKMVSRVDNGYHPPTVRVVETFFENDENCKMLQRMFAQLKLRKENAVKRSNVATGLTEKKADGVEGQTAKENKEDADTKSGKAAGVEAKKVNGVQGRMANENNDNEKHTAASRDDTTKPLTKTAKRRMERERSKAKKTAEIGV